MIEFGSVISCIFPTSLLLMFELEPDDFMNKDDIEQELGKEILSEVVVVLEFEKSLSTIIAS